MNARQKNPTFWIQTNHFLTLFLSQNTQRCSERQADSPASSKSKWGNVQYLWRRCSSPTVTTAAALLYCIRLCTHVHMWHDHSSKQSRWMWKRPESVLVGLFVVVQPLTLLCFSSTKLFIILSISRFAKISAICCTLPPPPPHWLYLPPTSDLTWSLPVSVSSVNV